MRKVLILMGRYLPGHKDGGPLRTMINVTDTLGDEYEFYIACWDRDKDEDKPYDNVKFGEWNKIGKANVYYVPEGGFSEQVILELAKDKDVIYLSSFYDEYGYRTLKLKKQGKITVPVALASMGVFSKAALKRKALKKKIFIFLMKTLGYFKNITWSVTSELEAIDVKKHIGKKVNYVVAEDLPRNNVPGKCNEGKGDRLKIAFLSRICAHKNLDFAIRVISKLKDKPIFNIYGPIQEPEYFEQCKTLLNEYNVSWVYHGDLPSDDVQKHLSKNDVLIFPSKSENYGHVVFEALSVGVVPVISDTTPWKSVEEFKAGFELPLIEERFIEVLDNLSSMDSETFEIYRDNAVNLAKEKIRQAKEKTGYREIFNQYEK